MIEPDEHSKPLILSNAEYIDTHVTPPGGEDLMQNAIEKNQ